MAWECLLDGIAASRETPDSPGVICGIVSSLFLSPHKGSRMT
jgi:hypothetical protein